MKWRWNNDIGFTCPQLLAGPGESGLTALTKVPWSGCGPCSCPVQRVYLLVFNALFDMAEGPHIDITVGRTPGVTMLSLHAVLGMEVSPVCSVQLLTATNRVVFFLLMVLCFIFLRQGFSV